MRLDQTTNIDRELAIRAAAARLLTLGLVPILLASQAKKPIRKQWQNSAQAEEPWNGHCNIGVRCDGLFIIDEDNELAGDYWRTRLGAAYEQTTRWRSAGGLKVAFRVPPGQEIKPWAWHPKNPGPGDLSFDIQTGPGKQVVIPPSVYVNEEDYPDPSVYTWEIELDELVTLTPEQVQLCHKHRPGDEPEQTATTTTTSARQEADRRWNQVPNQFAAKALQKELEAVRGQAAGGRNNQLNTSAYNLGQLIAAKQLDLHEVQTELEKAAAETGLGTEEAQATIASGIGAGMKAPRDPPPPPKPTRPGRHDLTDMGNARRLVEAHGVDLKYSQAHGWLVWDDRYWVPDRTGEVERRAKDTVRAILTEAATETDLERQKKAAAWAFNSQSAGRLAAMIRLTQTEIEVAVHPDALDRNKWLLPAEADTLDLRTGQPRAPQRTDLITLGTATPCRPSEPTPLWEQFIDRVTRTPTGEGDPQMRRYLQQIAGYTLTGVITEQCLFFLYGTGRNGKTTFIEVLRQIMGDYATVIDPEVLMAQGRGQTLHPSSLAILRGKRMAICAETETGRRLAESRVKQLTGGDPIQARQLYQDPFQFSPEFKIWMYGNSEPDIRGLDEGIWRRIKKVPFDAYIRDDELIPDLQDKMIQREAGGILAWAVQGCLDWQQNGLVEPDRVKESTRVYRSEQDTFQTFADERLVFDPNVTLGYNDLKLEYAKWHLAYGEGTAVGHRKVPAEVVALAHRLGHTNVSKSAGPIGRGEGKDRVIYGVCLSRNYQSKLGI